jgi:hypothetical protein
LEGIMTKLLKVRILLPILLLVYVLLGGLVVPWVDRTLGHVLLTVLAVVSLVLVVYGFHRFNKYHEHDASMHKTILVAALLAGVGLLGVIVHHIVLIATGDRSLLQLYGGEVTFVVLALGALLVYANNKPAEA